ncbi:MAG: hypothetical protein JXB30_00480 [Anaerolineae bacterium]|nr:hypothetical protein [Anaerolineae bacterium]
MGETPTSDNAVWLMGKQHPDGSRAPGIVQKSIQAMREVGALDEIGEMEIGLIAYPGAAMRRPAMRSAGITGVWFNWLRTQNTGNGRPLPERMQDVPKPGQQMAKERIAHLSKTQFLGMRLRVAEESGRLIAFTERGNLFGYSKGAEGVQPGDVIELGISTTKDGNMRVQYEHAQTQGASLMDTPSPFTSGPECSRTRVSRCMAFGLMSQGASHCQAQFGRSCGGLSLPLRNLCPQRCVAYC